MKRISFTLENILFILFVLFMPFQDFGLQIYSGYLGSQLSNIPLILLVIVLLYKQVVILKKIPYKWLRLGFIITFYVTVVSIIPIVNEYFDSIYIDYIIRGYFVNYIILFIRLFSYIYICMYFKEEHYFLLKYLFAINVLGFFCCDVLNFQLTPIFHLEQFIAEGRARGWSLEPSYFGYNIVLTGLLYSAFIKNRLYKGIIISIMLSICFFSGSKGGIILVGIIALMYIIRYKCNFYLKCLYSILLLIGILFIWDYSFRYIFQIGSEGVENVVSLTTRLCSIAISVYIAAIYPLGCGISGVYQVIYLENIFKVYNYIYTYSGLPVMDYYEIIIQVSSGVNYAVGIGAKSGFFNNVSYYGIPFIIIFVTYVYIIDKIIIKGKNTLLWLVFWYSILGICTFVDIHYDTLLVWGIIIGKYKYEIECEIDKIQLIKRVKKIIL